MWLEGEGGVVLVDLMVASKDGNLGRCSFGGIGFVFAGRGEGVSGLLNTSSSAFGGEGGLVVKRVAWLPIWSGGARAGECGRWKAFWELMILKNV